MVDERDSEYDLRLGWQDEEEPPPSPEEWNAENVVAGERVSILEPMPDPPDPPRPATEPVCGPLTGSDSAGSNDEIDLNLVPVAPGSAPDLVPSNDEIDLNLPSASGATPGPDSAGSNDEIDLNLVPASDPAAAPDSVSSNDEIELNLPPAAASPLAPAPVPIEQLLPWLSPAPGKPVPESPRLNILLVGVLIGAGVCFALWLVGLEPPSSWRLSRTARTSTASLTQPETEAAVGNEKSKTESAPQKAKSTPFVERLAVDFATAVDLAQNQQYPAAIEILQRLCASLEQREMLNVVGSNPEDEEAEQALLKTSYELLASWQLERSLAQQGILTESRDTAEAVENLLVENKRLRKTLEGLDAKLPSGSKLPASLADRLDRVLRTREEAERQAALLPLEQEKVADARKNAQEALTNAALLESKLKAAENKLQRTESQVRELLARREAPAQLKPIVLPALTLQPVRDARLAYEHYTRGLGLYRDSRYADAEKEFVAAVHEDDQDARYHYYLGLARWSQGKQEAAAGDFREGARMERENKPSRVFVTLALERVDEAAAKEMNRFRPSPSD